MDCPPSSVHRGQIPRDSVTSWTHCQGKLWGTLEMQGEPRDKAFPLSLSHHKLVSFRVRWLFHTCRAACSQPAQQHPGAPGSKNLHQAGGHCSAPPHWAHPLLLSLYLCPCISLNELTFSLFSNKGICRRQPPVFPLESVPVASSMIFLSFDV